jgi:hypothetical protein
MAVRGSATGSSLQEIYEQTQTSASLNQYHIPLQAELNGFKVLFRKIIEIHERKKFRSLKTLEKSAGKLGFQILRVTDASGSEYTAIAEKPDAMVGRGIYILADRKKKIRPVLIQTPHSQSDANTGKIGINAIENTDAAAFFSSTVRRNTRSKDAIPSEPTEPADVAHNSNSFFHAATEVFGQMHPDLLILQLHGFDPANDETDTRDYNVIISEGRQTAVVTGLVAETIRILREAFPDRRIAEFGVETHELGARTNVQGKFIRKYITVEFLHLELSQLFRKELVQTISVRNEFFRCLNQVISAYETH